MNTPEIKISETELRQTLANELFEIYKKLSPKSRKKMEDSFRKLIPADDSKVLFKIGYNHPEHNPLKTKHNFYIDVTKPLERSDINILDIFDLLVKKANSNSLDIMQESINLMKQNLIVYHFKDWSINGKDDSFYFYKFVIS